MKDNAEVCFPNADIDECVEGVHGCSRDAECINDQGSYYCVCTSGYEGDGVTCSGKKAGKYSFFVAVIPLQEQ